MKTEEQIKEKLVQLEAQEIRFRERLAAAVCIDDRAGQANASRVIEEINENISLLKWILE